MTADLKNNILQRTQALFFKYGIKSVTMDDVARELGISKKTLYQFFDNKNDLLEQVMLNEEARDIEMTQSIPLVSDNAIDELIGYVKHGVEEFARLMPSTTIVYDLQKYYRDIWTKFETGMNQRILEGTKNNIRRGQNEGLYRIDMDADIIAKLYVSKMMCLIDEDMFPSKTFNKVHLFQQYMIYHVHGIATPKGIELFEMKMKAIFG